MTKRKKIVLSLAAFAAFLIFLAALPFILPQSTYKNWFLSQLQSAVALRVEAKEFRLTFLPLPGLVLQEVKIYSKNAPFTDQLLAEAGDISVSVALSPLFSKQVIASLTLEEPILYFRTTADGGSNFQNLLILDTDQKTSKSDWQFKVTTFNIEGGVVQTWPANFKSPQYEIQNIDASVKNLSLAGKSDIPVSVSLGILGGKQNVSLKGDLGLDPEQGTFVSKKLKLKLGNISADLKGDFDSKKMGANLDLNAVADQVSAATLEGQFPQIFQKVLQISKGDMPVLSGMQSQAHLKWTVQGLNLYGSIRSKGLNYKSYPLQNVRIDFNFAPPKLDVKSLSANIFGTTAEGNGSVVFQKSVQYSLNLGVQNVDLTQIPFLQKVMLGTGSLQASLSGQVSKEREALQDLNATGLIQVAQGSIPSLQLGEAIFGNSIWHILSPLAGFNREELQNLRGLDAGVEKLSIPFQVKNGKADIVNGKWQNPRYQIQMNGSIGLNQSLSGSGAFLLNAGETKKLITDENSRKTLSTPEGEMELPFVVGGTLSQPKIDPDKKVLSPRFTKAVITRGINVLNPENIAKDPAKALEAPVNILKGLFGK